MSHLSERSFKLSCLLLYAAPVVALADPVIITTHSTGTARALPGLLQMLGMDRSYGLQYLPYELTLTSTYDPGSLSRLNEYHFDYDSAIVVDFRLGDMRYHASGNGRSGVRRSASDGYDTYEHQVEFLPSGSQWSYKFAQAGILNLPSTYSGGALKPRELGLIDVVFGHIEIGAYPVVPDAPVGPETLLDDTMSHMAVQVSVVPEPAPFVMLAVGVLTLGLRRRFGHSPADRQAA